MIDNKKIYTLKSCLVEVAKLYDNNKSNVYIGIIRQVDIENLNMVHFYSNSNFNNLMEEIRKIRHNNINGGPVIFHNKYFLPINGTNISNEEKLFFIYKKSQGVSLSTMITDNENPIRCHSKGVILLLKQISSGLNFLHDKDIVHGELTPDCIHLSIDGTWKISYVGFFYILSHLRSSSELREYITLYYKSPDAIQTNYIFTKEEDVWAFSIIIYNIYCDFKDYYFENLDPILQCEPDLCLLNIFENYGPFGEADKMPKSLFNMCAGGIWKRKEERMTMDVIYEYIKTLTLDDNNNIICSDENLNSEFIENVISRIDSYQKPNYDEVVYIFQTMVEKIFSHNDLSLQLKEEYDYI
ncbi:Protein kinase domain and Serine-threonine/tyrosine-protein kinase catalytic domain and Serine/threonine-/dual specificity protein kinase, catalytic domain and Protein kinase-like domain-containing protein [Strongyloides ratti]|uniref:Protein kinase domain-containing protein n=1 Tax=Strongyloides ratti TaxID=34506 RepID=A0A090L8R4_STRRB|nr:Protein kinase domain and Serine-threonine/tyrosine-protein kinase catalytic domain and Serine/threonine-/dual specificity protein kinase, catalytic domain and Protein kinase-like domain-containing protein [Strongyloides ratti]CEF63890.1 Protein kinase domain and Serine-threonine/tyrosine-protein kinase catalytic domain and Serine/threonine-/dual specificity protein kinase, catalytic domain and Protein kinase-like domain-containing protein [Strongyloides ratti]